MKASLHPWLALVAAAWVGLVHGQEPTSNNLVYLSEFEPGEGFLYGQPLRGQMGWVGEGSGGNGLVTNYFENYGQHAFIGFNAPAPKDAFLNLWKPLAFSPQGPNLPVVRFSVLMEIDDSSNGFYDDFRWSVYNTAVSRLFSLDFDNSRAEIFYALDDNAGFTSTGFRFVNAVSYQLDVFMNLRRNTWTAMLNGLVVVDSQPMTTINARIDLSDIDAVWAIRQTGSAGDNYMVFDDYTLSVLPTATVPPILEALGRHNDGSFELIVHGERGLEYALDVTSDLVNWEQLGVAKPATGVWDFVDTTAPKYTSSFYRVRETGN